MTKRKRIEQYLTNGILDMPDIARLAETTLDYVNVIKSEMKRKDYYQGYKTRKMREARAK